MAFCDTRTVDDSDYMPFDRVISTHVTELMYLRYSGTHKWHWLSEQSWDEPVLFTTWDSATGNAGEFLSLDLSCLDTVLTGLAKGCVAHVAFDNPLAKKQLPQRQSIETTLLVITRR